MYRLGNLYPRGESRPTIGKLAGRAEHSEKPSFEEKTRFRLK